MSDPHDPSVLEQQRDRIRSELASIGDLRPGPLREKHMRCGKPTCRCQREDDPGHGPYFLLDRQTGGRKTTRSIPAEVATGWWMVRSAVGAAVPEWAGDLGGRAAAISFSPPGRILVHTG